MNGRLGVVAGHQSNHLSEELWMLEKGQKGRQTNQRHLAERKGMTYSSRYIGLMSQVRMLTWVSSFLMMGPCQTLVADSTLSRGRGLEVMFTKRIAAWDDKDHQTRTISASVRNSHLFPNHAAFSLVQQQAEGSPPDASWDMLTLRCQGDATWFCGCKCSSNPNTSCTHLRTGKIKGSMMNRSNHMPSHYLPQCLCKSIEGSASVSQIPLQSQVWLDERRASCVASPGKRGHNQSSVNWSKHSGMRYLTLLWSCVFISWARCLRQSVAERVTPLPMKDMDIPPRPTWKAETTW